MGKLSSLEERTKRLNASTLEEEVEETGLSARKKRLDETPQQATINSTLSQDLQPEHEAKVYDLSKRAGYDVPTVRVDPARVENQVSGYKPGKNEQLDFYMGSSLAIGQPNTAISGDDHEALGKVHKSILEKTVSAYRRGEETVELGNLRSQQLFGDISEATERRIQELKTGRTAVDATLREALEPEGIIEGGIAGAAEQIPILLSTLTSGVTRALQGAAIATGGAVITGQPEAIPTLAKGGARIGFKAGSAEAIFKLESGLAYDEFLDFRDESGQPLSPEVVWGASVLTGVVNAGLEFASLGVLLKTIPGAEKFAKKPIEKVLKEALRNPTKRRAFAEIFKKYSKAVGFESLTEAGQELFTILFGEAAKKVSEGEFDTVPIGEAVARIKESAKAAIAPTVVFGMPGSIVGVYQAVNVSNTSQDFHANLDNEQKTVQETATQERSRDHMKEALKSFNSNEDVYISSKGINKLFQEHTTEETFEILENIGVDAAKARETIATGEDTVVPRSEITTLAQEEYNIIKDDVKEAPGAYTRREITDKDAAEDVENSTKVLEEDIAIQKEIDTEISRLTVEIAKTKLPDAKIAGDATVLLRGLAEKIQSFGLDPVEQLKNISFKRTAFAEFKERVGQLFQAGVEPSRELELQLAEIDTRISRITPQMEGATERITQLETEKSQLQEQIAATLPTETFFQATGKKRGAITIDGEKKTIELFEGADLSTVLHEIGHVALLDYSAVEQSGKANDELKADMKTIREWVGNAGEKFTREQSEQFARGFEAYLREGKAPTAKLRIAFERFKQYLTGVYESAKLLDVTLNKDVRQVFDRMVAANAEVERAAREAGFVAKTDKEMDALGMSDVDKFSAKKLIDKTVSKASELLTKARNKSLRLLRGNWHAEAREEIRSENLIYDIVTDITKGGDQITEQDLNVIRRDIEEGEPARRTPKRNAGGEVIGVTVTGGTFPTYFMGQGFTKKDTLNIIDKALAGKKLTDRQQTTLNLLVEGYKEGISREAAKISAEPVFKEDNRFDRLEFIERYGENAISDLLNKNVMKEDGIPIDQTAMTYGIVDGDTFINRMFDTLPFNEAVDIRVAQKQAEHDASFIVEDYLADLKSYRDYQNIMAGYIRGATVNEATVDAAVQRNVKRWEKEARERNPDATEREIADIVQDKIEAFRQKQAKPKALREAELKRLAKETMAAKKVKDAQRIDTFMAQVKKAEGVERRAILRKDWGAASTAHELAEFNYEMASLSKNIRNEVNGTPQKKGILDRAKKAASLKQGVLEHEYQEAILHLTSRYKLSPKQPTDPADIPAYNRLFAGDDAQFNQAGERVDPNISNGGIPTPAFLASGIDNYRDLRVEQLRELDDAIQFLAHQGKRGGKDFLYSGERLDDVMPPILQEMDKQKGEVKRDKHDALKGVAEGLDTWYSRMLNLSYITKALGGFVSLVSDKMSVLEQKVTERLKDLRDAHLNKLRKSRDAVKPHRDRLVASQRKLHRKYGVGAGAGNTGVSLKEAKLFVKDNGVPIPPIIQDNGAQVDYWEVEQVFDMAFHRMNDGNTQALVNGYGLTVEQIDSLLDQYLTKQDMDDVQAIIDIMGELAPETNEVHRRINGFPMRMVEARPFTFKGKEYKGGYYPLNIDRKLASVENDVFASAKEMEDYLTTTDNTYVVPFAKSTHTLGRREGHGLPVHLSLGNIDRHLDQAIRYITMAEGVKDVDRIITYKKKDAEGKKIKGVGFKASATRVMGENVYDQLRPALKHFSNPIIEGVDSPGRWFVGYLRGLAIPAHLAWKTITGVKQFGSIPIGISVLGKDGRSGLKKYAKGVGVVGVNPSYAYHTMNNKSDFMMERQNSYERDFLKSRFDRMTPAQREVSFGDRHITWTKVKDLGYATVRIPDLISVTPIWWAGYLDKIEQGVTEKEAVRYADNIIEDTQPIAQPLDLSAWQREGGLWSVFNLHQTFTVAIHGQRQRVWKKGFKKGEISLGQYAMYNYMEVMVPSALSAIVITLLRGGDISDPEEQKDILASMFIYMFGTGTPMLGSTLSVLFEGSKYAPIEMAGGREFQQTLDGLYAGGLMLTGFKGMSRKERDRAIWAMAKAISIQLKVPVSDVAKQLFQGDTIMGKIFKPKKKKK